MIVDTSALLAYFDSAEPRHDAVRHAIESRAGERLVVSPYIVAEVDYLVATRIGVAAELAVLTELSSGAWELATLDARDVRKCAKVVERYIDQATGIADASNVVLAEREHTKTIVTLDRKHFDVLRPLSGGRFTVIP